MKNIVIFEDGKGARGSRAKLIKRGNKRVLIEFVKFNYEKGVDEVVIEWFKIFSSIWNRSSINKRNNKRKSATYYHKETNEFYNDSQQTVEYKSDMKKYFTSEYYEKLYGEIK